MPSPIFHMHKILIYIESRYPADRKRIRNVVSSYLKEEKLRSSTEVSVAVVGNRKMRELNKRFRCKEGSTTVLSFSLDNLSYDGVLRLGDVVISYPQAVQRAIEDNVRVDDKIDELLIHGLKNLLGKGD